MKLVSRLRSFLSALIRRSRLERELRDEMRFHLDAHVADLVRAGVPEPEARRRARIAFGSVDAQTEECRAALGLRLYDEIRSDLRYGLRQHRRSPAFAAVAVISLALGIGANAAIFSLMEAALWSPLPVPDPGRLRLFSWTSGSNRLMSRIDGISSLAPGGEYAFSYPVFLELERQHDVLDALFAFKPVDRLTAIVDGHAEVLRGELVTGGYFEGLRLQPAHGRALGAIDEAPGSAPAGVISDAYWTRRFGRDPSTIGTRIIVNGTVVTIVGVNPPWFTSAQIGATPDIFLPLRMQPIVRPERRDNATALKDPDRWWLLVLGRLRAGVDVGQAETALEARFRRAVATTLPDRSDRDQPRLILEPGDRGLDLLSRQYATPLVVLVTLAAAVLLMACANVASLLLARVAVREREIALRRALGAGSWRVARQLITEGLLLAGFAGAAGILLGYWLRDGIPELLATTWRPGPLQAEFNWRVLGLTGLATSATGVLFSLAPAWRSARADASARKNAAGDPTSRTARWWRGRPLVAAQVGLSVLLLAGAGLFARTVWNLGGVALGFQPDRVLLFVINPPPSQYEGQKRSDLLGQLQERIGAIPDVERVSLSSKAILSFGRSITGVNPDPTAPPGEFESAWVNGVAHGFFDTMEIPLLSGRSFETFDRSSSQPVAVVNREFVRRFFAGQDPVGKTFRSGRTILEVIGVVGDARYDSLTTEIPPTFYTYLYQGSNSEGPVTVAVRTATDDGVVLPAIRDAVRSLDATLPLSDIRRQSDQIAANVSRERLLASLSLTFATLAVALAGIGIYGVIANGVARRTREIGIRLALGARRGRVLATIVGDAALVAAVGVAFGVGVALGLTRFLRSLLFGVEPVDPATLIAAALLMLAVALVAGWLPARRAARLDPMAALRHD